MHYSCLYELLCRVVSCRVVSCRVVSCRVVSCRVVLQSCVDANFVLLPFYVMNGIAMPLRQAILHDCANHVTLLWYDNVYICTRQNNTSQKLWLVVVDAGGPHCSQLHLGEGRIQSSLERSDAAIQRGRNINGSCFYLPNNRVAFPSPRFVLRCANILLWTFSSTNINMRLGFKRPYVSALDIDSCTEHTHRCLFLVSP